MENTELLAELKAIAGDRNVLTSERQTERFRLGFRSGGGEALAVVLPQTLMQLWKILKACSSADKIVIMQAANTGLTEGSTPSGSYDRGAIIINTLKMDSIIPIDDGRQVVAFSGSTLFELERLLKPLNRQPHSVIGSSCIGASIVGGVCNNSGGSLVQRGPSYTEMALYAQIGADGEPELINHLGIDLGESPEEILENLERGNLDPSKISQDNRKASDTEYGKRVRDIDADSPARFNADKTRLYEASGCAGKLAVFAVRLDTYPLNERECVYYIGTNDTEVLGQLRREILSKFDTLPESAEYMHREVFDIAEKYGKDTLLTIHMLGTGFLPRFFAMKGNFDAWANRSRFLPGAISDRLLQLFSNLVPNVLPRRMMEYRDRYEHHLILKVAGSGIEEASVFLKGFFENREGNFFEANKKEAKLALLHRFAAAGAAVRYQAVHAGKVEDMIALDIALRRNDNEWFEVLPEEIDDQILHKLYYGHFLCHVLHQDYIVKKGCDSRALKKALLALLDKRGAEYPAEHNVGHLYYAKADLAEFYRNLDPTNSMNPGIGKMSKKKSYAD